MLMLLVDDSVETLDALALQYGINLPIQKLMSATNGRDAWEILNTEPIDIASIDIQLGIEDGIFLCQEIRSRFPKIFIIICSLDGYEPTRKRAFEAGASYFLSKPFCSEDVVRMFDSYLNFKKQNSDSSTVALEDLLRMIDE